MSVYTIVEQDQLETFLMQYDLGQLLNYEGISHGIENTNYFVTTTKGKFVLTIFEQYTAEELPYFLELMAYLSEHQIPSAHPIADKAGHYLRELCGKPAALVQRLCGASITQPNVEQCQSVGTVLGRLHAISADFPFHRPNARGTHWWHITAKKLYPHLSQEDANLLKAELHFQHEYSHLALPRGVIHADLFRDNALFDNNKLCGVIDFYYACNDVLLYDLAVTVNDWCSLENGHLDQTRLQALLSGYVSERALSQQERDTWQVMLRAAALRFWLSRLQDMHFPREGEITHIKNPDEFKAILQARSLQNVGLGL